jgi:hypothetical protein
VYEGLKLLFGRAAPCLPLAQYRRMQLGGVRIRVRIRVRAHVARDAVVTML